MDLFSFHGVRPPPQEVVRPVVAEAEPPPKRPPAFVRQVPELNHHVPQEVVAPEGVPVVDADPDLCVNDTVTSSSSSFTTLSRHHLLRVTHIDLERLVELGI